MEKEIPLNKRNFLVQGMEFLIGQEIDSVEYLFTDPRNLGEEVLTMRLSVIEKTGEISVFEWYLNEDITLKGKNAHNE